MMLENRRPRESGNPESLIFTGSIYFQSHWIPACAGMTTRNMPRIFDSPHLARRLQ